MSKDEKMPKRWVACPIEEEYFGDDRKLGKQERKIASAKDRSKYKKTDREKHQKPAEYQGSKENLLRGRVLTITPQGFQVEEEKTKVVYVCNLRGALKKDKSQFKNLVTVGDFVLFEATAGNEGYIAHVEARRSVLSRADNLSRRKEQLIAANVDQVIITTSVVSPPLKPFLIDRYIIAAHKGGMQPIIAVNKIDLFNDTTMDPVAKETDREILEILISGYKQAEVPVILISVATGEGMEQLKEVMKGKVSVFSGQSGVGKSSLINAMTGENLKVGKIVGRTQKGAHTTSTAQLMPLSFGGWVIDTPGIKSFGVWDLSRDEIENYFPEIHSCGRDCKFPDCRHLNEQNCAVMQSVEDGGISPLRYESYQILIESLSQEHLRR